MIKEKHIYKSLALLLSAFMFMSTFLLMPDTGSLTVKAADYEYALFPGDYLDVTQGAYGEYNAYSHNGQFGDPKQNAFDLGTNKNYFAPFTGTITKIYTGFNAVVIQSSNKVYWANGTLDYMSVCFVHDNDISNLKVGTKLNQGDVFYQPGVKSPRNNVTGPHVHMCVNKGKTNNAIPVFSGDIRPNEALYLKSNTKVVRTGNYKWTTLSSNIVQSIAIATQPSTTVYPVNGKLNTSGLTLKATYYGGTTKTISSGFTVSSVDMTTVGTKTVTVTYAGKTATFKIIVEYPKYTVTLNAAGGNVSPESITVQANGTYSALPIPQRNGYTFDGWYTEETGGTKITSDSKVNITADQTLFAHWTIYKGDCDNDSAVTKNDLVMLQNWLLGSGTLANSQNADMNGDGKINVFDLVELRSFVALSSISIELNASEKALLTDDTFDLTAKVSPENSIVEWSSSDNTVASVSDGKVKAVAEGSAIICAVIKTEDGDVTAECRITVSAPSLKLASVSGSSADTYIYKTNNKLYSMVTKLPACTTNMSEAVTWSVISGNAVISGDKLCISQPGTITARASVTHNGKTYTADYTYKRTQSFTADVAYTLRSKPSTSGSSLASIPKGTTFTVSAIDLSDSTYIWGKVTYNNQTGYVILWKKDGSDDGIKTV